MSQDATQSKYCPNCGQPNPIDATICSNCGYELPTSDEVRRDWASRDTAAAADGGDRPAYEPSSTTDAAAGDQPARRDWAGWGVPNAMPPMGATEAGPGPAAPAWGAAAPADPAAPQGYGESTSGQPAYGQSGYGQSGYGQYGSGIVSVWRPGLRPAIRQSRSALLRPARWLCWL